MKLSVGIVGLPNAGKSTLFNALVGRGQAETGRHPFTTIKPNKATVNIPDERLETLFQIIKSDKKTPAQLTFIDVAGLIKGAHQGEGLGNEFLGHIREVNCILHVLRAFDDPQIPHPFGEINPKQDMEIVETELLLADSQVVERHLTEKGVKGEVREFLQKAKDLLDQGKWMVEAPLTDKEKQILQVYPLLTAKPIIHIVNVSEKEISSEPYILNGVQALRICAQLESELTSLPWVEQRQYLKEAKIKYSALEAVILSCYHKLYLSAFYTVAGGKETRAWTFQDGTTAIEAAGMIHTDMQRGFIKAEVLSFEELVKNKSWEKAKQQGKVNLLGRDYQVKDGDILEIKFSK